MQNLQKTVPLLAVALLAVAAGLFMMRPEPVAAPDTNANPSLVPVEMASAMSFFVTSANPGRGGDFGGLAGADAHCQALAAAAGAGNKTWHAYLSTVAMGDTPAENAKDRIGAGPWHNSEGILVAKNLAELHGVNNLSKGTALTEKGEPVSGRGDTPNNHDILTGSLDDGTASPSKDDTTCANWTSSGTGAALVGHHDRIGANETAAMKSWSSAHASRGCSLENLRSTGGAGLTYCFAVTP